MAIAFRSKGAWVAGTTSISMTMPTTHAAGDLLLMFIHTCNNAVTTPPGNGWQLLSPSPVSTGSANTALGVRLTVYWKIAQSSSEAAQTVAVTGGTATNGITVAYSGVDNTTPFDLTPVSAVAAASTANLSFPTLTTVTNGAMIVNAVALDNDGNSSSLVTSPVNASLESANLRHGQTVSTSTGGGISFIDGIKTTVGLISATTATVAAAARAYLTIALRPIITESHTGTFSISQSSSVESLGIKRGKGNYAIDQASAITISGVKKASGIGLVSQPSEVVFVGKKKASGVLAISQASEIQTAPKKVVSGEFNIPQDSSISVIGKKIAKAIFLIDQTSAIVSAGIKLGIIERYIGEFVITQASSIVSYGIKRSVGISTIFQGSNLSSNGRKVARSTLSITQNSGVSTSGRKMAIGSVNITSIASITTNGKKIAYAFLSISVQSAISITGTARIFTDEIIAGIRRGTSALFGIVHGRSALDNRAQGTSATLRKSTGIFRINNKKKGTVEIND